MAGELANDRCRHGDYSAGELANDQYRPGIDRSGSDRSDRPDLAWRQRPIRVTGKGPPGHWIPAQPGQLQLGPAGWWQPAPARSWCNRPARTQEKARPGWDPVRLMPAWHKMKSAQISLFSSFSLSFTCLFTVLSLLTPQPTHDFGVPGITSPTLVPEAAGDS